MSKAAELDLERCVNRMREEDPRIDEKMAYWNHLMDKFNTTGLSPMQLSETAEGQKALDKINKTVGAGMTAKFGE